MEIRQTSPISRVLTWKLIWKSLREINWVVVFLVFSAPCRRRRQWCKWRPDSRRSWTTYRNSSVTNLCHKCSLTEPGWFSHRSWSWCFESRIPFADVHKCPGGISFIVMLRKWATHHDGSCVWADSLFVPVWFGQASPLQLLPSPSRWSGCLWHPLSVHRPESLSQYRRRQFRLLLTTGKCSKFIPELSHESEMLTDKHIRIFQVLKQHPFTPVL